MKNTEFIKINWNCIKSINQAERRKSKLENLGYNLISSNGNLLEYKKQKSNF